MNCILKKFILKRLNKLLDEYKDNVGKARDTVEVWTTRAKRVTTCLESLSKKLEDNELSDDELEEAIEELTSLVKGW